MLICLENSGGGVLLLYNAGVAYVSMSVKK